ncbi:MAG TPA: hypothetical protein VFN74_14320 [Chloroflexota bacterium]|nr:hypothetical protein [Chloroflexota bacterium]
MAAALAGILIATSSGGQRGVVLGVGTAVVFFVVFAGVPLIGELIRTAFRKRH